MALRCPGKNEGSGWRLEWYLAQGKMIVGIGSQTSQPQDVITGSSLGDRDFIRHPVAEN